MYLGISSMTFYIMISTYQRLKRLSQKYADRINKHPNIVATNLMKEVKTTRRLKRKLPQDLYI